MLGVLENKSLRRVYRLIATSAAQAHLSDLLISGWHIWVHCVLLYNVVYCSGRSIKNNLVLKNNKYNGKKKQINDDVHA